MIYRFATVACLLLAALAAIAQMNPNPPAQTERVETGTEPCQGQSQPGNGPRTGPVMCHYRIRLLPVSSFPQLPAPVAQQLKQRDCMIPQTYEAREPENVIQGSFEKKGSDDWAALCSVNGTTTLYVFFQSNLANPIALRHQPDAEWLGVEWSLDYGSAWGIAVHSPRLIEPKDSADHDGIDDSYLEKSSTLRYFQNGQWTTRDTGQ